MDSTYLFYIVIMTVAIAFMKGFSSKKLEGLDGGKRSIRLVLLAASFLALFLPLILRDVTVGIDYANYRDTFNYITGQESVDDRTVAWLGWPFIYLVKLAAPLMLDSYIIFYGLLSFVSLVFLYGAILKSKIPWLSLLLFISFCLYFQMFNQMRQLLAVCILLYSMRYIISRNFIKYVLLIGLASVFHMTALLFLPMYVLAKARITRQRLVIYVLVGLMLAASFTTIISIIALTPYGTVYLGSLYDISFSLNTVQNFILRLVILGVCLVYAKRTIVKYPETNYYYNIVIYCTLLQVLAMYSSLFGRLTTMFFVAYVILIPAIIYANYIKTIAYRRVIAVVVVAALAYQYIYYNSQSGAVGSGYEIYKIMPLRAELIYE